VECHCCYEGHRLTQNDRNVVKIEVFLIGLRQQLNNLQKLPTQHYRAVSLGFIFMTAPVKVKLFCNIVVISDALRCGMWC